MSEHNEYNQNKVKEIVEGIIESADELVSRGKKNLDLVEQGQLIAYAEALSIIRDAFAGTDLEKIGLDFDIDEKYLQ